MAVGSTRHPARAPAGGVSARSLPTRSREGPAGLHAPCSSRHSSGQPAKGPRPGDDAWDTQVFRWGWGLELSPELGPPGACEVSRGTADPSGVDTCVESGRLQAADPPFVSKSL